MTAQTKVGFGYLALGSLAFLAGCTFTVEYHKHDHAHESYTATLPELLDTMKGLKDVKANRLDSEQTADERVEDRNRPARTGGSILPG